MNGTLAAFFGLLAGLALAVQFVTFETMVGGTDVPVGVAWFWYGASVASSVGAIVQAVRWSVWLNMTKRRADLLARFRHWGMESEVAERPKAWVSVALVMWCVGSSYLTATVAFPVLIVSAGNLGYVELSALWFLAVWYAVSRMFRNYRELVLKRRELDALGLVFHERFPASEILSMYECMRAAPRVFWEEYANLPAVQVTEATNRKFRERAAPYAVDQSQTAQRTNLAVAVVAVVVALFVAVPTVFDLLTGGASLLEWLHGLFSTDTVTLSNG